MKASSLSQTSIISADKNHLATELNGETVILSFATGSYFGLDEVGSVIWKAIQQPTSISQICEAVMSEYDVPQEECYADIVDIIQELVAHQLATVAS